MLLTAAGIAAFCFLGFWQLQRAADKAALLEAFARSPTAATISLANARRTTAAAIHPRIRVRGTFAGERAYVLDDQVRNGRQGIMVYGLFEPSDGSLPLLVNRGFLARNARTQRAEISEVAIG
ncbi:MAG: SURF1 family protein, partial [Dokdonella sp.]